jgi:hypothetical protein
MADVSERDIDIVARTILGEALNEPYTGKIAVASVIANRAATNYAKYGFSPADQALAGNGRQFNNWMKTINGRANGAYSATMLPASDPRYQEARSIAEGVLKGVIPDPTGGATHYYNPNIVRPAWAREMTAKGETRIGDHVFGTVAPGVQMDRGMAPAGSTSPGKAADSVDRYAERASLMRPRGFPTGKPGELGGVPFGLVAAPASSRAISTATQPPSTFQQIASWLSNIADRANNPNPRPPVDVPKIQDRIAPEQWGGPLYTSSATPLSSGMRRTPTGTGTKAAPVAPVTRATLPGLSTAMRTNAQDAIDTARRPAPSRSSAASMDATFASFKPSGPDPLSLADTRVSDRFVAPNPFSFNIGDNQAARAPRITPPTSGARMTVRNVNASVAPLAMGTLARAASSGIGMAASGVARGAQNAVARIMTPPAPAKPVMTGLKGAIGDPRRMDLAGGVPGARPAPKPVVTQKPAAAVPALPRPVVVRTVPPPTPAVMSPERSTPNAFEASGMRQIGTAPSGAALYSNGNGQVFAGKAPSNALGGMGFGGGGGSFRGVNNY